jgi:hypothetical protein
MIDMQKGEMPNCKHKIEGTRYAERRDAKL